MSNEQTTAQPLQKPIDETSNLLENLKGSLGFIEGSKATADGIISALNQARGVAEVDVLAISEGKQNFEKLKVEIEGKIEELTQIQISLKEKIDALSSHSENLEELVEDFTQIKKSAEELCQGVESDILSITQTKEKLEVIEKEISEKQDQLNEQQQSAEPKIKQINDSYDNIISLADKLLKDRTEETRIPNGDGTFKVSVSIVETSVQKKIQELFEGIKEEYVEAQIARSSTQQELETFKNCIETEITSLKFNLENEIRSLLPSASAAGLAHGYVDAKGRYIKWGSIFLYYMMFVLPLVVMAFLFWDMKDQTLTEVSLLFRFLVISPLLAISSFGLWSIRLNRRLYEEYNYKQRVMELYHGFTKVINEEGEDNQKKELINIMLETVKGKPSLAMSKYDRDGGLLSNILAIRHGSKTAESQ